jgi:hypothetical protein
VTICQKEGRVLITHESATMPAVEVAFRFGETFDYAGMFGLGDTFRVVETLRGDTIEAVLKGPRFTLRNYFKFTQNFVIAVSQTRTGLIRFSLP